MRRGLATRARLYTVSVAVIALVVAVAVFWIARSSFIVEQRTAELSRQARAIASGLSVTEAFGTGEAADSLREQFFRVQARLTNSALFVTDANGAVASSSGDMQLTTLPLAELDAGRVRNTRSGVRRSSSGLLVLLVATPIPGTPDWLVAAQPVRDLLVSPGQVIQYAIVAMAIALLVAWVVGGLLARRLIRPIGELQHGAQAIADGDWGAQVPEGGDAEIASLARSFNEMSSRVADAYASQKAFVSDVSHELKTPITSIVGFSQAVLDGTVDDPAAVHQAVKIIHDEAERMAEMSQTLLALARLDARAIEVAHEPLDLRELTQALTARFVPLAADAGLDLNIALAERPRPIGDFDRLLQAATALVSNAIAYTPQGGRVRIRGSHGDGSWRLEIEDSGPGIPPDRRDDVFKRFTRLDPSRAKSTGGSGLGLAIALKAVQLMNGTIEVADSADLGGARFTIALPAEPPGDGRSGSAAQARFAAQG